MLALSLRLCLSPSAPQCAGKRNDVGPLGTSGCQWLFFSCGDSGSFCSPLIGRTPCWSPVCPYTGAALATAGCPDSGRSSSFNPDQSTLGPGLWKWFRISLRFTALSVSLLMLADGSGLPGRSSEVHRHPVTYPSPRVRQPSGLSWEARAPTSHPRNSCGCWVSLVHPELAFLTLPRQPVFPTSLKEI